MLGNMLGGFIVILIGVNLIPVVADQIESAQTGQVLSNSGANLTGAASTILDLTTIFFALGIMAAGVSLAVGGLRNAGLV